MMARITFLFMDQFILLTVITTLLHVEAVFIAPVLNNLARSNGTYGTASSLYLHQDEAKYSIDGDVSTCATTKEELEPWLLFVLPSPALITTVVITNRMDWRPGCETVNNWCECRMLNTVLSVDGTPCAQYGKTGEKTKTIMMQCDPPVFGSQIKLTPHHLTPVWLNINEVEIYDKMGILYMNTKDIRSNGGDNTEYEMRDEISAYDQFNNASYPLSLHTASNSVQCAALCTRFHPFHAPPGFLWFEDGGLCQCRGAYYVPYDPLYSCHYGLQ